MTHTFLDKDRSGEVTIEKAVWLLIQGTTEKANCWGVGRGNQWMQKPAFNAWWNTFVLKKYSHPLSTIGLHIHTKADVKAGNNDNIGVVHQDYAGGLVDMSDWKHSLGWCQVGVLGASMYSRQILGDPKLEKASKAVVPWPRLRGLLHTIADDMNAGNSAYILIEPIRHYVIDRFNDFDKDIDVKLANQVNAFEDYHDAMTIFAPIEEKARERVFSGKKNGKSRMKKPLLILTTKGGETPVNMLEMDYRRYKIYDGTRLKKGIYPQLWDGSTVAVENFKAVAENGWRIHV